MASSPSGPPSRLAYANPTWGMSRDERWLQDIVSSQRMSLEPTLTLHPRNQRLTEEEMLGGKMFSRSVPSPSSLSARTVSPTGKMDTLCSVVRSGTTQAVYKHLHESCVDINDEERTESGKACTPLSEAIRTRNHCTARLLLDFEADPTQGLSDSPTTTAVSLAATSADSERLLYPKLHGPHTPGFTIFLRTHLPSFRVLRRRSHLDGGPQGELLEERAGEEGGSLLDHHIVDQGYPGNPAPALRRRGRAAEVPRTLFGLLHGGTKTHTSNCHGSPGCCAAKYRKGHLKELRSQSSQGQPSTLGSRACPPTMRMAPLWKVPRGAIKGLHDGGG